jgi:hypothetical protein
VLLTLGVMTLVGSRLGLDLSPATRWFRRTACGLAGHTMLLHFEPSRLSLECSNCGERTPGWAVRDRHGRA